MGRDSSYAGVGGVGLLLFTLVLPSHLGSVSDKEKKPSRRGISSLALGEGKVSARVSSDPTPRTKAEAEPARR